MAQNVVLLILDGWGHSEQEEGNAILAAKTPTYDSLLKEYPHTLLNASGSYVGLPEGIMGNSEVGHENIGAGRVVKQKLTMISDMVKSGEFFENEMLSQAFEHVQNNEHKVHLMGLISEGDVHAHLGHLDALIEMAKLKGIDPSRVYLHAISDGRDDPPYVAAQLMASYQDKVNIATVSGRYWAMDRDNNWDRIEKYFDCVTKGKGEKSKTAVDAINDGYRLAKEGKNTVGDSDEFILPTVIDDKGLIEDGDSVIFFNFRPDRARQISSRIGEKSGLKDLSYVCFTEYSHELSLPIAFSPDNLPEQDLSNNLGEYLSNLGLKQFRTAETEKFNHVTSFFNGGHKTPYENEDRNLIPSPKVATYDLKPEMSILEVTDSLIEAMAKKDEKGDAYYKFLVCNFANPDMVGHTGNWEAVTKALATVDQMIAKVVEKAKAEGYALMITADHGNADQMLQDEGGTRTAHSCNPVPFVLVNAGGAFEIKQFKDYPGLALYNIAPTVLSIMKIDKPSSMTAESLLV